MKYHQIFLDSQYKAPPMAGGKPFFALFNASNYWLQAALCVLLFVVLQMMPFMREAAQRAGGADRCPSLWGMITDAFVRKSKPHNICNQTPEDFCDEDEDDENEVCQGVMQRRLVREARYPPCPLQNTPDVAPVCEGMTQEEACCDSTLPFVTCCGYKTRDGQKQGDQNCQYVGKINVRRHKRSTSNKGRVTVRAHCRTPPGRQ